MIRCPECKKLVDENLKECSECGYVFAGTEEQVEVGERNVIHNQSAEYSKENENSEDNQSNIGNIQVEELVSELNNAEKTDNESDKSEENVEEVVDEEKDNKHTSVEEAQKNKFDFNNIKKKMDKRGLIEVAGGVVLVIALVSAFNLNSKYKALSGKYDMVCQNLSKLKDDNKTLTINNGELEKMNSELTTQNEELITANSKLESKNNELENGASKQLVDIKNAYEKGEWKTVIDLTDKLHKKYNGTDEDNEAQEMAKTSQAKIDEANAAKAAEEAKGYETGITYDQLARTPDDFIGKKVKFYGKVVQVIEGKGKTQIRLAVNDNYDTVLFCEYPSDIVSSRVLEDDHITVYGGSMGTISYQSTMGGTITIPSVYVLKIDQ